MKDAQFILQYVSSCMGGQLRQGECAPLWQFGIIMLLLVFAIAALIVIRVITSGSPVPQSAREKTGGRPKRR